MVFYQIHITEGSEEMDGKPRSRYCAFTTHENISRMVITSIGRLSITLLL